MKDSNLIENLSWLIGVILLVTVSWIAVGAAVRIIKTLFCWGYGC